jgi:hypothetical protein
MKEIIDFLMKFAARPGIPFTGNWSWDYIIQVESVHFLCSACVGFLAFLLIWTIFSSSKNYKWSDRYTFRLSLLFGIACSVTIHILVIDGFTTIA